MKKIILVLIVVLMISLFSSSCSHENSLAAETSIDWTQLTDPGSGVSTLSVVYSITNTGKEDILGFSIVFQYAGGFSGSVIMARGPMSQEGATIFPAVEQELDDPILPGAIYVDVATYTLSEGTVISSVEVSKLHIWSERKERVYEY
jgi:hypothetical protein